MARMTILSWGGGQDSTAILFKLANDEAFRKKYAPENLWVIMSDTGNEHPQTGYYLEYVKQYCIDRSIPFFFISCKSQYFGESWRGGLVKFMNRNKAVPSKAYPKSCTDQLKIRPIYKFVDEMLFRRSKEVQRKIITSITDAEKATFLLQESKHRIPRAGKHVFPILKKRAIKEYSSLYGKIDVLLGIASGEEKRLAKPNAGAKWMQESINKVYPLIDLGMDRKACQVYIESIGELIPYPSNCMMCPFMSLQELLYLYTFHHDQYVELCVIEKNKVDRCREEGALDAKNLGVWGTTKMLPEMLDKAFDKYGDWTEEELLEYKMSHGHCVTSSY